MATNGAFSARGGDEPCAFRWGMRWEQRPNVLAVQKSSRSCGLLEVAGVAKREGA